MKPLRVVIETPRGSRNKYAWDPKSRSFTLKKVLPLGMSFPWDFGFVPGTKAGDGDPVDILVLMDEPAFPGCEVEVRLVGVIEGEQTKDGETDRNDRLIGVAESSLLYRDIQSISDLDSKVLDQVEQFFVNYLRAENEEYTLLGRHAAQRAKTLLKSTRR